MYVYMFVYIYAGERRDTANSFGATGAKGLSCMKPANLLHVSIQLLQHHYLRSESIACSHPHIFGSCFHAGWIVVSSG